MPNDPSQGSVFDDDVSFGGMTPGTSTAPSVANLCSEPTTPVPLSGTSSQDFEHLIDSLSGLLDFKNPENIRAYARKQTEPVRLKVRQALLSVAGEGLKRSDYDEYKMSLISLGNMYYNAAGLSTIPWTKSAISQLESRFIELSGTLKQANNWLTMKYRDAGETAQRGFIINRVNALEKLAAEMEEVLTSFAASQTAHATRDLPSGRSDISIIEKERLQRRIAMLERQNDQLQEVNDSLRDTARENRSRIRGLEHQVKDLSVGSMEE